MNALQADIAAHGAGAYYYAHAASSGGIRTTLGEAPRLLSTTAPAAAAAAGAGATSARATRAVDSFAYADDGDNVRVYVDFAGAAATLADEHVSLATTPRGFTLEVRPPGAAHTLVLARGGLFGEITGGRAKRLRDRILVVLTKAAPASEWYELEEPRRNDA
jgi:hypothetical protein